MSEHKQSNAILKADTLFNSVFELLNATGNNTENNADTTSSAFYISDKILQTCANQMIDVIKLYCNRKQPAIKLFAIEQDDDADYVCINIATPQLATVVESISEYILSKKSQILKAISRVVRLEMHEQELQNVVTNTFCEEQTDNNDAKSSAVLEFLRRNDYEDNEILLIQFVFLKNTLEIDMLQTEVEEVIQTLQDLKADMPKIRTQMQKISAHAANFTESAEISAFIQWILQDNFFVTSYAEYKYDDTAKKMRFSSKLGTMRTDPSVFDEVKSIENQYASRIKQNSLIIRRSDAISTILRHENFDVIYIRAGAADNEKCCFISGFFAPAAYYQSALDIPIIRSRVNAALLKHRCSGDEYNVREAMRTIQSYPRAELLQMSADDIYALTKKLSSLSLIPAIKALVCKYSNDSIVNVWVFIPKDKMSSTLRENVQAMLMTKFSAKYCKKYIHVTDAPLAKLLFVVKAKNAQKTSNADDEREIEAYAHSFVNSWDDLLLEAINKQFGKKKSKNLFDQYSQSFSQRYKVTFSGEDAIQDIQMCEKVLDTNSIQYKINSDQNIISLTVYSKDTSIELSSILPLLENLGLITIKISNYNISLNRAASSHSSSHSYDVNTSGTNENNSVAPSDATHVTNAQNSSENIVSMQHITAKLHDNYPKVELNDKLFSNLEISLAAMHYKLVENDSFNALVTYGEMTWRESNIMRAISKYIQQNKIKIGHEQISKILLNNIEISKKIIHLFKMKFLGKKILDTKLLDASFSEIREEILNNVQNSEDDIILRAYVDFINAVKRTNYGVNELDRFKNYVSFKIRSKELSWLKLPKPYFEIFVYSAKFEGIHLRGGKIARGGLRWSDRHNDYRYEVLDLMKAQVSKNSIIVPTGAKGGFIIKDKNTNPETIVKHYKDFLSGMLDITDNIDTKTKKILKPQNVLCYDTEDDPYLVVAADKGTASFSDYANEVAEKYNFWLGNAFASGGSEGYSHKDLGITAKGAWVTARQRLQQININPDKDNISVVGIGDMSGDVFGNGLLETQSIRLVAAFNHAHIFIDPKPNAKASFAERERLFKLKGSKWSDYKLSLISSGGGVFNRSAKFIDISKEMQQLLDIPSEVTKLTPDNLITYILKAHVDMIWNGGIGTYVKSKQESHADASDRANDNVRINGSELRCSVFAEGGNLGLTQKGRIEYAICGGANGTGGLVNTDAIDNSAGVDCSDHEVNIKLALKNIVASNLISDKEAKKILKYIEGDVINLVLRNNYLQGQIIDIEAHRSKHNMEDIIWLMTELQNQDKLDLDVAALPTPEEIRARAMLSKSFVRPEISVLLGYSKNAAKDAMKHVKFTEDSYYNNLLLNYFPKKITSQSKYTEQLLQHDLNNDIIINMITTDLFSTLGLVLPHQFLRHTGLDPKIIIDSFVTSKYGLQINECWKSVEDLLAKIDEEKRLKLFIVLRSLIVNCMTYLMNPVEYNSLIADQGTEKAIVTFKVYSDMLINANSNGSIKTLNASQPNASLIQEISPFISDDVTKIFKSLHLLPHIFRIINISNTENCDVMSVANIYYYVREQLLIDKISLIASNTDSESALFHENKAATSIIMNDIENIAKDIVAHLIAKIGHHSKDISKFKTIFESQDLRSYQKEANVFIENAKEGSTSLYILLKNALERFKFYVIS